jgi:RNA polymerase sigma factor (sigma-70 family)
VALSKQELETVYRDLEAALYNFALRWVFDAALAEEVVHEAFIRIWNQRDAVAVQTLKGLLFKTVQNLAYNEIRRRKLRETLAIINWLSPAARPSSEDGMIHDQELVQMRQCLEKLPRDLREVLLLAEFSQMSYAQLAVTLNIAEGTVASRKSRALQMMRQFMTEGKNHG